jgi:hypothetical protein
MNRWGAILLALLIGIYLAIRDRAGHRDQSRLAHQA